MATFTVDATTITFRFPMLAEDAELVRQPAITVRHIPGGNVTYTDYAGLEAPRLKGRAQLDTFADLTSLQALQGRSGTLVYSEATYTAQLLSCRRSRAVPNIQFVDLEFLIAL